MIYWCVKHRAPSSSPTDECMYEGEWGLADVKNCDIREALLIVKENGEWPVWLKSIAEDFDQYVVYGFLDRLALASVGDSL